MQNNQNFILAIVLSIIVLFGWQYFISGPQVERAKREQELAAQTTAEKTATPTPAQAPAAGGNQSGVPLPAPGGGTAATTGAAPTPAPASGGGLAATREEALARSPRIAIETPKVSGSIALRGGRIDDIHLNEFHETVDPKSSTIVLLNPAGRADGYFAEFGWLAPAGSPPVPGSETLWTAPANAKLTPSTPVTLTYDNGAGLVFKRTIAIDDAYMFTVTDTVDNAGAAPLTLYPYGRVVRNGEPHTAGFYILHEGPIGVFGKGVEELSYSSVKEAREKQMPEASAGWIGITDKYWAAALVPEQGKKFAGRFSHSNVQPTAFYQADFRGDAVTAAPGASATVTTRLFAGAKQVELVNSYRDRLGILNFDLLIDWGWFYFITKPMFFLLDFFYRLIGNFGLAILLVTVLVKAAFFPLANKSYRSMSAMKKMQPQMMEIRERYANDKMKQQQALMELYKKAKINPIAGCWPMLIQIPVFFALYKVLFTTIEMRHAPFFGWIKDLSGPDPTTVFNLFGLLSFDPSQVPMIGHFLMLGVWPLLMGVTMWLQMRLNPTPPDPTQAMIFTWMPVLFTFMLSSFPAGLVIYWAWNNLLSITQQTIIMKREGAKVELWDNVKASFSRKPKPADKGKTEKPETKPAKS